MSSKKVIVFGATGAVGRAAALEAHNLGAQVYLAMRDTKKPTPGIPDTLPRIQADLTNPASIGTAVKETGATAAFIYTVHGANMRPAAEALKKAGIQHIVLLSSFTVYPNREHALKNDHISRVHAEAEMALEDVGVTHTFIRPMYFASNLFFSRKMIQAGEVAFYGPDSVDDYIAPEDIGAVAGVKLTSDEAEIVPLTGPELIRREDAWKIAREVLDPKLKLRTIPAEEFDNDHIKKRAHVPIEEKYPEQLYKTASQNIKRYTGREPIKLRAWLEKHKADAFDSA